PHDVSVIVGGAEEEGDGTALAAGTVDLPAGAGGAAGDVDGRGCLAADEVRVERGLGVGVVDHCPTEGGEVAVDEGRVAAVGATTEGFEAGAVGFFARELGDDLLVDGGGVVAA